MINRRYYIISIVLSICVLLETLAMTYMQHEGSRYYYSCSILYFVSGLVICIIPVIPINKGGKSLKTYELINRSIPFLSAIFFVVLVCYHLSRLIPLYANVAIDKQWADMLPTIRLACLRFLEGKTIYAPAPEIWDNAIIPYLPFMWIPFLPAILLGFDLRWVTFTCQFLALLFIFFPLFGPKRKIPFIPFFISCIGLYLLLNFLLLKRSDYWCLTEEGVIAAFYLLLSFTLLRRNYWLIGIAMMACTLSRYSLILWIPGFLGYMFFACPRSDLWKLMLSYCGSIATFFIIPFFIKDPAYFIHIPATYTKGLEIFWIENNIDQHLYYNVGFFKFFSFKSSYMMPVFQVITSFSAPVIFLLIAGKLRKKFELNEKYIAYSSLKMSLIFFFGFIQIPYLYIFVPVTIISYTVLFDYIALQNSSGHDSE